jgi:hypothetical protein
MNHASIHRNQLLFALFFFWLSGSVSAQTSIISGTIVDVRGAAISSAHLTLKVEGQTPDQETNSDENGHYSFSNVAPAPFQLAISAPGFAPVSVPGSVKPGESLTIPPATLEVAHLTTDMEVTLTQHEIAEEQVKSEEQQRLFGVLPNYYVTYDPHPAPLTARQKFDLAFKTTYDPVNFLITGIIAGVEQSRNTFGGYGQGAEGYGKRYGAAYGDFLSGVVLSGAVFPALMRQDPRYYYKGTGSRKSRVLYAIERAFISQGDNGRPQFAYASILGGLAAGGLSNLYYPAKNRDGAGLTFENAAIGIASNMIGNIVQEFFFRKVTTKSQRPASASTSGTASSP